jgi:hypothetical protein
LFDYNINLNVKNKIKKSNIIKSPDINYAETFSFNKKILLIENDIQNSFFEPE